MAERQRPRASRIADWEWELIHRAALTVPRHERDELIAELAYRLLIFKARASAVRHWSAYLKPFLKFRALDWAASRRKFQRLSVSIDDLLTPGREHLSVELLGRLSRNEGDFGIAFQRLWDELPRKLRRLWITLAEHGGNQIAAAKTLRLHRNTVRAWMRRIQQHLRRHEYGAY